MTHVRLGRIITISNEGMNLVLTAQGGKEFYFCDGEIKESKIPQMFSWMDGSLPPLYPGFKYIDGVTDWRKEPYAVDSYGNPYNWIPVALLPANGTLDDIHYDQQFGRRNYDNSVLGEDGYHEEIPESRIKEVLENGGFPFPSNPASKGEKGLLQFKEGFMPINNISPEDADEALQKLDTETVEYRSFYDAEWDSVCEWLKMNGYSLENSTSWGNYANTPNREYGISIIGSRKESKTIGINDFAGGLWWISKTTYKRSARGVRGGSYSHNGHNSPAGERYYIYSTHSHDSVGVWAVPFKK